MKTLPNELTLDSLREFCLMDRPDRDALVAGLSEVPQDADAAIQWRKDRTLLDRFLALYGFLDRIVRAQSILEGREAQTGHLWERISRCPWIPILIKYNPCYPVDTLPVAEALLVAMGRSEAHWCCEDIDMVWDCLPEWSEPRLKLGGKGFVIDGMLSKHSSVYVRISLPNGTMYPCEIKVERHCDMDQLANHGDYCPQVCPIDEGEPTDDCDCESWVERTETLTLTEDQYQGQTVDAIKEDIRAFLERVIWTDLEPEKVEHPVCPACGDPVREEDMRGDECRFCKGELDEDEITD